jgi:hypothetical protein
MLVGKLENHIWKTESRSVTFTLYQNQLKCIKDLNIRPDTMKQLQDEGGNTREQSGRRNNFLNRTQKAQHLRDRMNKWVCIKLKSFCPTKESDQTQETAHRMGENLSSYSSNKGLISRISKKKKTPKNQNSNEEMRT